jgi:hypothetical protein
MKSMTRTEQALLWTGVAIVLGAMAFAGLLGETWFLVVGGFGVVLAIVAGIPALERERATRGRAHVVETFAIWFFVLGMSIAMWLLDQPRLGYVAMVGMLGIVVGLKKLRRPR